MFRFCRMSFLAVLLSGMVACQSAKTSMPAPKGAPAPVLPSKPAAPRPQKASPAALAKNAPAQPAAQPAVKLAAVASPPRVPEPPAVKPAPPAAVASTASVPPPVPATTVPAASARAEAARPVPAPAPEIRPVPLDSPEASSAARSAAVLKLAETTRPAEVPVPRKAGPHAVLALGAPEDGGAPGTRMPEPKVSLFPQQPMASSPAQNAPLESSKPNPALDRAVEGFHSAQPPASSRGASPSLPQMDFNTNSPWFSP